MFPGHQSAREASSLGPLEARVMDVVWAGPGATVRDVMKTLGGEPAYTTVMTTLDRLFKKGLLTRRRDGRGFAYSAHVSRSDLSRRLAGSIVAALLGPDSPPQPILAGIVDAVSESDVAALDELERLVHLKRCALVDGEP